MHINLVQNFAKTIVPLFNNIDTFFLSIHCFNNEDGNADCDDFELSYFLECTSKNEIGKKDSTAICVPDCKFRSVIYFFLFIFPAYSII